MLPDSSMMRNLERAVYLRTIDMLWMDHLDHMQALRDAVSLQGYGQKDPLVEYKKEGFLSFEKLLGSINRGTLLTIFHLDFTPQQASGLVIEEKPKKILTNKEEIEKNVSGGMMTGDGQPKTVHVQGTIKNEPQVGRNDPCPCGSGKKYKKCHGKELE
jgi:preprotein translocase subunit SecA